MTKIAFVKGIEYLNAYYVNFKFDIDDKLAQKIWYQALSVIDDKSFELTIIDYCKNNVYAPQSPTHLLEWFDKLVTVYVAKISATISQLESKNTIYYETSCRFDYDKAIAESSDPTLIELLGALKSGVIKSNTPKNLTEYLFASKNKSIALGVKLIQ